MRLVQASASAPELQARLRDTLNMARDTDKWRKLTRMLAERVSSRGMARGDMPSRAGHVVTWPARTLHGTAQFQFCYTLLLIALTVLLCCCCCVHVCIRVQVVWDDSTPRLFVVPTGSRPLGLLFRANKGQVDFEGATGRGHEGVWWVRETETRYCLIDMTVRATATMEVWFPPPMWGRGELL